MSITTPDFPSESDGLLISPKKGDSLRVANALTNSEGIFRGDKSDGIGESISGKSSSINRLGNGFALLTNMNC